MSATTAAVALAIIATSGLLVLKPHASQATALAHRVVIIFDPTIETQDIGKLLQDVSTSLINSGVIREGSEGMSWVTREEMMAHPEPIESRVFSFRQSRTGPTDHAREVEEWYRSLTAAWSSAYSDAHAPERVNRMSSCLLSTLYSVGDFLKSARPAQKTDLFMISDMLEACADWGPDAINLEGSFRSRDAAPLLDTLATEATKRLISLQAVTHAYVLVQPHTLIRTPLQRDRLQQGWTEALSAFGLARPATIVAGVPKSFALVR